MKIEQAYNIDSNEIIDAELAYDYYWAGIIKNKKNFECPAENCSTPITCANLDKIRQDMKVDPYFKSVGNHHPDCELVKEILTKSTSYNSIRGSGSNRAKKSDNLSDIFEFSRPESHLKKIQKSSIEVVSAVNEVRTKKRKSKRGGLGRCPSRYYSLRAFVSKYLRYESLDLLENRFISIKGNNISYQKMFVRLSEQNLKELSKYPRIYFGEAFINKRKETDYSVNFTGTLILDDTPLRPSTYISQASINDAFTKKLSQKKFEILSNKNYPSCWVFVYGVPKVKVLNGKSYININVSNLDYFDIRENIR